MSGKYEKKKQKTGRKGFLKWLWILLAVVLFAGSLALAISDMEEKQPEMEAELPETVEKLSETEEILPETETSGVIEETSAAAVEGKTSFLLDQDLEIIKLGSYTGVYMEDGTDDIVSGILMIIVQNNGENTLQYSEITLSGSAGDAVFKLSTLKPGEKAVVLEANRKAYAPGDAYTDAVTSNTAFFAEPISLQEDKLEIQPLDGGFNITNISGENIDGRITVYFKDSADGMYYGGITYRGNIEGGMKAGEIRQIISKNFSASGSAVVFVTITEN